MLMPDALSRGKLTRRAFALNPGGLVLMTDDDRLADPISAAGKLSQGSLVIVRARDTKRRAQLALRLRQVAWARGLILLIADDPHLARAIGANGIHLPEARARQAAAWRARNPRWLITASAHSLTALLEARFADAVLLSPLFPTPSHPGAGALGAARARLIAQAVPFPVFALGGINARNAAQLWGFGGIAAISALA
jgi:thiamine-phosphate pyrophosphorylase